MNRDETLRALGAAGSLQEQIELVASLDAMDDADRRTAEASRSIDWAETVVGDTLGHARSFDRHTASSDWLHETDTSGGENHHTAVIAEASLWFGRLDSDVRADAQEYSEQARGFARRTAGKYGERAEEAEQSILDYAAFLNRSVLAASGLPQVEQLVDAQENPAETPLPTDVFDTFEGPIHPINEGVSGTEQNSLAPGAEEALSGAGGSPGGGRPSEHEEGQGPTSEPYYPPASAKEGRKTAGALETAKHQAAQRGHAMQWTAAEGVDSFTGRCSGCGSSMAVTAAGIVGGNAHTHGCTNRSHALLGSGPSVAIGYTQNLDEFLAAQAAREAGGAAPFVREPEPVRAEAASGLDQVQQTEDSFENPKPSSLPQDVMFPIVQPWGEESTDASEPSVSAEESVGASKPSGDRPYKAASRKTADMYGASDTPHAVPGGQTPVGNTPQTTPQPATSGDFDKGVAEGRADAQAGDAPTFADASATVSDYVRGYTQGFGEGAAQGGSQDVPGSMGGDNNQAQNATEIAQRTEKPLTVAKVASAPKLTVSASLLTADVSGDEEFQRGYRYARSWKSGDDIVARGSKGEEAGIYAGITDNPGYQHAWAVQHRALAKDFPELNERLDAHRRVTASYVERNEDAVVKGLYVQAGTSLDLDTMSPQTSPDPQGATPSEGPGTVPVLRDAPGSPAEAGGPAPYNGVEPIGAPVVPDAGLGEQPVKVPQSPDAVNMTGSPSITNSPQSLAFRQQVQANKLALRQKGSK